MTPHIGALLEDIAENVIMPGDPSRAKFIAENYLEDYKLVNQVRGMLAFTGTYKGKKLTIFASGMGIASMGIYSYELFDKYNVKNIIRIGTCGAYTEDLHLLDVVLVESCYAKTDYDLLVSGQNSPYLYSSLELNNKIKDTAEKLEIPITFGRTHCSDAFYRKQESIDNYYYDRGCIAVEMEAYSLFQNANYLNKQAACILTVSDNVITKAQISVEDREKSLRRMIELALNSVL